MILVLAFMVSCSNKNTENNNVKNTTEQTVAYTKPENPKGPTVALNSTDFKIENEFIYYQGNIFTGKITFDFPDNSGYFFVSDGKLQGETNINYKLSRMKRLSIYENGRLTGLTQTENNVITEVVYSDDSDPFMNRKIVQITTKYNKNSYLMDFQTMTGVIQKNGKTIKNLTVDENDGGNSINAVFDENGDVYNVYYSFTGKGEVSEKKYKLDSKNQKHEILVETRKLSNINTVFHNGLNLFRRMWEVSGESTNPVPALEQSTQSNSGNAMNTTNTANPETTANQNDEDLALLDRVYSEVMHNNNTAILNTFSKEKLGYIRNTLFAKKGYKFKNPKYANYFSQKSWYRGIHDSDEILNPEEKRFVLIIKEREK